MLKKLNKVNHKCAVFMTIACGISEHWKLLFSNFKIILYYFQYLLGMCGWCNGKPESPGYLWVHQLRNTDLKGRRIYKKNGLK